ncbi:PASTA domain-containing protein [Yinghuangia sp. YIM S10712]|uniref:PASTA domain-containing protein n=1 Tax=Yinghuangia sp. YIM S10712 TaxID=3436930 RepID=UPI003F534E07
MTVRLTIRNAGDTADSYRVEPVEQVDGELRFDEAALTARLAPGGVRTVELRYTPPRDRVGAGLDVASRFGVPGADLAREAGDAAGARFGIALRVVSQADPSAAACAAFAVDVPGRVRVDRSDPGTSGGVPGTPVPRTARRGIPLLVGAFVLVLIVIAAVVAVQAGGGRDNDSSAGSPPGAAAAGGEGGGIGGSDGNGGRDGGGSPPPSSPGKPGGGNGNSNENGNGNGKVPSTLPPSAPKQVEMRDLYGLPLETAERELAEDGLKARVVVDEHSGIPKNNVRGTEPEEGVLVDVGSTVVLHVADGKFQLRNYVGQNVDTAAASLRDLGLNPVKVPSEKNLQVPHMQVVAMSPRAESWVQAGDSVTLTYQYNPIK